LEDFSVQSCPSPTKTNSEREHPLLHPQ